MKMWTRAVLIGAVGLTAGGAVGCAEEREPINRTQPNALSKSFFVGEDFVGTQDDPEFYARQQIVDIGYGAAQDGLFTSTYAAPPTVIKWEIQEDLLLGRITYNRIEEADSTGDGASSKNGQLAYAFPIISHFDVRRDYNPSTGEEGNVIGENTSDRHWDQRTYFRVDWSRNLNTDAYDFDTLSLVGLYGSIQYEPLAWYVNDPASPDAPHFSTDEGYFDVTTKALATPGLIDLSHLGWGVDSYPACYLPNDILGGSWPFGICNPSELTLRMSFRRVETSDYEPVDWDGNRFAAFGIFYGERFGYARNYGIVDQKWHRFAARYNIWEKSHAYKEGTECKDGWVASTDFPGQCEYPCYTDEKTQPSEDPNRDCGNAVESCRGLEIKADEIVGNGTADECEPVGAGSQCDQFKQKCTLPYTKRTPAPVVWHYTKNSNNQYYLGTEWATHEWDVAMRTAVRVAQYGECVTTEAANANGDFAGAQAACAVAYPMYTGQQEENEDAVALSREVDDCKASQGSWKDADGGSAPWSESRVEFCKAQAKSIGNARGYAAGVISIAEMDEMVTLCHGPVEATDSPACIKDLQRLKSDAGLKKEKRKVLPEGITAADCDYAWENEYDLAGQLDQTVLDACDNGFYARIGDLRYHQVNVIRTPQTPSPWGIMVDADDPRTGEKIHASVNVWSHVTDLATQGHVDMMRYIKGELETSDVTNGTYVRDWASAAEAAGGKGVLGTMDRATVERRKFAAVDGRDFDTGEPKVSIEEGSRGDDLNPQLAAQSRELRKRLSTITADNSVTSINRPFSDARRMAAMDSTTEADLVTPAMMQLGGMNQSAANAPDQGVLGFEVNSMASSSILRTLNPQIQRDIRNAQELGLAARGSCMLNAEHIMSVSPNTMVSLAGVMERKFGPFDPTASKTDQLAHADAIQKYLAQKYQYAVMIHEMGHSIGHRHNFVSSSFAFGYRPQYWQLRTKDGTVTNECDDVSADGEDCIGPRYLDPPTQTESDELIWMWQHSSVMDYPGELSQDMLGLGAYDYAATRMFYGNTVAVHAEPEFAEGGANDSTIFNISDTFGGIIGYDYVNKQGNKIHYSQLQNQVGLIKNCVEVDAAAYQPKNWDTELLGTWDSLVDGFIVTQDGRATRCKSPTVDYVPYDKLRAPTDGEVGAAFYRGGGAVAVDAQERLRVPYGFATDSWADAGNASVFRHDNGADIYELFNFFITEQETRHIFDNYRRNRTSFSVRTQSGRILGRYNEKMRDAAKGLGLLANIYRAFYAEAGQDYAVQWANRANTDYPENILASGIAFDHFARQLQRPESGGFVAYQNWQAPIGVNGLTQQDLVWRTNQSGFAVSQNDEDAAFIVFDGATGKFGQVAYGGKLVENRLSDNNGEFDRDYQINAGSYYDKVYAPYLLTESVDNFISDSYADFTDPRYRAVSMADLFPDGYRRLLANNLTNDDFIKGARIAANPSGPTTRPNPTLDDDKFPSMGLGTTTWWTSEPEVCFPGEAGIVCSVYGCPTGVACGGGNLLPLNPLAPVNTTVLDPSVSWEQQKFLFAQTLIYLPENQKNTWINMLGLWEVGADTDPGFENRIELHLPDGKVYVARTYGTEVIFGKTVQRGIAARVLEYANELMRNAYVCTEEVGTDGTSWCIPEILPGGKPVIRDDPGIAGTGTECSANRACIALENYQSLPTFMRQSLHDFRMADASMKGIYD